MVEMDFADQPSPISWIVNRILGLLTVVGSPGKELSVGNFDFSSVPHKIDSVFGVAKIPLDTQPAMNTSLSLDYLAGPVTGAFSLSSGQPLPAGKAKGSIA